MFDDYDNIKVDVFFLLYFYCMANAMAMAISIL